MVNSRCLSSLLTLQVTALAFIAAAAVGAAGDSVESERYLVSWRRSSTERKFTEALLVKLAVIFTDILWKSSQSANRSLMAERYSLRVA